MMRDAVRAATGGDGFERAQRALDGLSAGLNAFGTLALFGLMVLINVDVVGRGVFGAPVAGAPEITRIAIVAIVYLQLSHALRSGRLTRSDLLLRMLGTRPRVAAAFEAVVSAIGLALMALMAWRFLPEIQQALSTGRFYGTRGGVVIPLWPLNAMIAVGLGATALQFLASAIRQTRQALDRQEGERA